MSHWCDVRIKLSFKADLEEVHKKAAEIKNTIHDIIKAKRDYNAEITFGSDTAKLTWCSVKTDLALPTILISGYTRWGLNISEASDIIASFISMGQLAGIDILVREDELKVYQVFKWKPAENFQVVMKYIPRDNYPSIETIAEDNTSLKTALRRFGELYIKGPKNDTIAANMLI